jgi:hypothetical protein
VLFVNAGCRRRRPCRGPTLLKRLRKTRWLVTAGQLLEPPAVTYGAARSERSDLTPSHMASVSWGCLRRVRSSIAR